MMGGVFDYPCTDDSQIYVIFNPTPDPYTHALHSAENLSLYS